MTDAVDIRNKMNELALRIAELLSTDLTLTPEQDDELQRKTKGLKTLMGYYSLITRKRDKNDAADDDGLDFSKMHERIIAADTKGRA